MASPPDDFPPTPPPTGSPLARDRGLLRSRRLTRWIAVTAVAGAAGLGSLYTHLLPGGSASPAPAVTPSVQNPATSSSAPATGGTEGSDHHEDDEDEGAAPAAQPTPQPPAQPPAPTRQQPHTTTGAS
ncbi:hypothetical protein [Streptomyces sp. NPDC050121]|jgi:hypothetical protein|uniref:hypothetical protein n=1 Tax=Streptomyces sp. NPDC050121 TaxID=3365601 RepID=UPI003794B5D0